MQFNSSIIYFKVTDILWLALRMEANLLLIALVALQILIGLRDMVVKMTPSGSEERSMN
jgi:hypothetical protein